LAGHILGKAAAYDGLQVVQTQSYGAEARGSAAKSEVIISDTKIGFPVVRSCDVLVAMSQTALDKNLADLKQNGTLLIDPDTVRNMPETKAKVFKVPAMEAAESRLKSKMYANIIILGALAKITSLVKTATIEKAIEDSVPEKLKDTNIEAFKIGQELIPQA
jgi:2-oxoglutarate ferredoxin oxidoreductase subunit gamma